MTLSSNRIDSVVWASAAAAAAFGAVLAAPAVLRGSALYWHIAAGRWMLENQAILRIDPFSYTFAGHAWQSRDWLAEVLIALAYIGAGWSGVIVLTAAAAAGAAGTLGFILAQRQRGRIAAVWLALAFVAAAPAVTAMPYLLALPCLVAWTGGLTGTDGKAPSLRLLPVMLVWANLSGTFVIGLVMTIVLAAEAVLFAKTDRANIVRGWLVFAGFAVVFGLITPNGAAGAVHAMRALAAIRPIESMLPLVIALPAASVLIGARRWGRLVLLAALFAVTLANASAALFLAAAAPLLIADPKSVVDRKLQFRPLVAMLVIAAIGAGVRIAIPLEREDDGHTPRTAFERVPLQSRRQPVLNDSDFGGFLIFREVKPFIDNRPLYSDAFRHRFAAMRDPGLLAQTLTRYHIAWTILSPANPAAKTMDGVAGWHRLYADQWAVVHVKNGIR